MGGTPLFMGTPCDGVGSLLSTLERGNRGGGEREERRIKRKI
jgi:hypothetical protein